MKCENLQFNLPLYIDDGLADDARRQLDAHFELCPLCRARLAEFQSLQTDLRGFPRAEVPPAVLNSVRAAVAANLKQSGREPSYFYTADFRRWLQFRLMPYGVGVIASLVLTFSLLMTLLSTRATTERGVESAQIVANRRVVLMASNRQNKDTFSEDIIPTDYAALNIPISDESPRLNPAGALLALTKSIARGKIKDEEVVVVADIFGNGIARIAEVVEAPQNRSSLRDLERALSEDPNFAPFVPAAQDNRSDVVRVIFKIQRVDVIEKTASPKIRFRNL